MAKQLNKMNKDELINLAVSYGVIEQAEKLATDNGRKDGPINKDYLTALEPFAEKINGKTATRLAKETMPLPAVPDLEVKPGSDDDVINAKPLSKDELQQAKVDDLFRSIVVVVTDHDNSQDVENDIRGRGEQFSWGNPIIGMQTEKVYRHNEPQYLYNGTIKHLKTMTVREKADGKGEEDIVKDRFTIVEVPEKGFTQEQLDTLRAKQIIQG